MSQRVPNAGGYYDYIDCPEQLNPYGNMCSMYTNSLTSDLGWDMTDDKNLLASTIDGLHSGVPTRTTPTVTPTTLQLIEQTFIDFRDETTHCRSACFVPPLIEPVPSEPSTVLTEPSEPTPSQTATIQHQHQHHHQQQQQQHQQQQQQQHHIPNNVILQEVQQQLQPQQQQTQPQQQQQQQQAPTRRRNMGGRRPTRTAGISAEEEERRQIRRERNKQAAARCRKRRMDHTMALQQETEGLEDKKRSLVEEIQDLRRVKDELEYMLESHRPTCRFQSSSPPDVKPNIEVVKQIPNNNDSLQSDEDPMHNLGCNDSNNGSNTSSPANGKNNCDSNNLNGLSRLNRPNTLPIFTEPKPRPSSLHFKSDNGYMKQNNVVTEIAGIPITTPSSAVPFNFDSLMDGGTGLTPVSTPIVPSCSSQQRNQLASHHHNSHHHNHHHMSAVDLSSPDANPPKLVSL